MKRQLTEDVISLARDAGSAILDIYESEDSFETAYKADNTPLTRADMAAHDTIKEGLEERTPNIPILSEESEEIPYETRQSWSRFWLVDPLDGTKEFLKKNGEFTVNIALVENGQPIFGVVYAPALERLYWAGRGDGAEKINAEQKVTQLQASESLHEPLRVTASRSHLDRDTADVVDNLRDKFNDVELIQRGSSLKICLIAEGEADFYPRLGPTMEWDTAAAECILREAGGRLFALNETGNLGYNKENLKNPYFVAFGKQEFSLDDILDTESGDSD